MKKKVLYLCTHNSARSQMAEGIHRHMDKNDKEYEVYSAGTEKTNIQPQAIEVMREIGIDISSQTSKTLERFINDRFDEVITVCDDANESCPIFPNAQNRRHWRFPDPSKISGTDEEVLLEYRNVRDAIQKKIKDEFFPE